MRTSHPPSIAAWILHRLGPAPETEAIAGDLIEQYQQGRSRLWYWREVIVAILTGTWSEVQQHSLLLLVAIAMAWILALIYHQFVTPVYLLTVPYVLGHVPRLQELELLGVLLDGPLAVAMGWTVARCARRCPIPAVFGLAGSLLLVGAWAMWKNAQIVAPDYHFSVWRGLCLTALLTALTLLGSGLLTGLPKRSIRTQ
jgi:hypothetical protein